MSISCTNYTSHTICRLGKYIVHLIKDMHYDVIVETSMKISVNNDAASFSTVNG